MYCYYIILRIESFVVINYRRIKIQILDFGLWLNKSHETSHKLLYIYTYILRAHFFISIVL